MRAATDADFNNADRYLDLKLEIFFSGLSGAPLTVSKSNFLIDVDWLEELSADSSSPFGVVSSNELTFRLYNENGMFSPTNVASPYYGEIRTGVPVALHIRPITADEVEWTQLGMYFITGWDAQLTGSHADVRANDIWYFMFNNPMINYPVTKNISYSTLLTEVFALLGHNVSIDTSLNTVLPYAFISKSTKTFIKDILAASLSYATCSKSGQPIIEAFLKTRVLRATLTDNNQIKSAVSKQSITKAYDGVALSYVIPNLSSHAELIAISNLTVPVGTFTVSGMEYKHNPVWDVNTVLVRDATGKVRLINYSSTQDTLSITVNNTGTIPIDISVYAYGMHVELASVALTDNGSSLLKVNNNFIQTISYANIVKGVLQSYISQDVSSLSVDVRGNPLLNLGEKIKLYSAMYNIDFTGIIQRLKYTYNGGLDCSMTVLNANIFE